MRILILIVMISALGACKADDAAKTVDTPVVEAPTTPAESAPTEIPAVEKPAIDKPLATNFGGVVEGATWVSISNVVIGQKPEDAAKPRKNDATWIAKFVAAIGAETAATDALPKCLPTYQLEFTNNNGDVASMGGVCGSATTVILVHEGRAFVAADSAAARALLEPAAE